MSNAISASIVNESIGKMLSQKYVPAIQIVDENYILITFHSKDDYKTYLESRDLELVGKKS
jgi:hypothetical protein